MKIKSICLLSLLLAMSCTNDREPAFKIGKVFISKARFENILYRFSPKSNTKVTGMEENKERKKWIERYINDKYILAEALNKGYGKKEDLKTKSEYIAKFVLFQDKGPYYKETILKNKHLTEEQIRAAYEKSNSQYYLQFIILNNLEDLKKYMGDSLSIKSIEEYNKVKKLSNTVGGYVIDDYLTYPFLGYWDITDTIWNMKTGQVCGPVQGMYQGMDRYFFIYKVRKTSYRNNYTYDEMRHVIKAVYGEIEERKLVNARNKAILNKAKPFINNVVLQKLARDYISLLNTFEIERDSLKGILDEEIMNYILPDKKESVSVNDLYNYIWYKPYRTEITSKDQIKAILKELVLEAYYWIDVQDMELIQTEDFILREQERYEEIIVDEFLTRDVYTHIKVEEDEIRQVYSSNKEAFMKPQKVILDILFLGNFEKAIKFLDDLEDHQRIIGKWTDDSKYNILKYKLNDTSYFDSLNFKEEIIREINGMGFNQVVGPLYIDNEYCILIKRGELDIQIPEYNKVKQRIKGLLESEKKKKKYASTVRMCKQKYKIKSFINPEDYY